MSGGALRDYGRPPLTGPREQPAPPATALMALHRLLSSEAQEALAAANAEKAWVLQPLVDGKPLIVGVVISDQATAWADMFDRLTCLEWVLHWVCHSPVQVRLYLCADVVPRSARRFYERAATLHASLPPHALH